MSMRGRRSWVPVGWCAGVLATAATLAAVPRGSAICTELEAAHRALLEGSFSVERQLSLTINGEPKLRELVRLTYHAGKLQRQTLSRELLDDSLVLEEGEEESALALPFACERLMARGEGRWELASADGTETVLFAGGIGQGSLRPLRWRSAERTRFLWKKLAIEAVADYREFAWR